MSAIQILNGTTDVTSSIDWRSLDCIAVVTKEKGSLKFDILNANSPQIPNVGDTIYLKYNGTLLFGGTCIETEYVPPRCLVWAVTAAPDLQPMFLCLAERRFSVPA